MDGEVWKPVVGYEGLYEVSDLGRVRSVARSLVRKNRWGGNHEHRFESVVLRTRVNRKGYEIVALCKPVKQYRRTLAHKIVMRAFVGTPQPGFEINHKNAIKTDNRLSNLEYCTHAENMRHAAQHGLVPPMPGEANPRSILTEPLVRLLRQMRACGATYKRLSFLFGIGRTTVGHIIFRRSWPHVA